MANSGLYYLQQFSKIQIGEIIGDIEAIDFTVTENGSQMGHLIITCNCTKHNKQFNIAASELNWKITKFLKRSLKSLDYTTVKEHIKE